MSAEPLENTASGEAQAAAERGTLEASVRRVYRLLDDGIAAIGGMDVAAGVCGVDRSDLRRSLDRRGRYLAVEHAMALSGRLRRYSPALATQIGAALVLPADLLVFPRVALTAEEKARRLEQLVRSMPMGAELVAKALETP